MTSPQGREPGPDAAVEAPTVAMRAPAESDAPAPRRRLGAGGLAAGAPGATPRPPARTPVGDAGATDARRPGASRSVPARPAPANRPQEAGKAVVRTRRAQLALQRIDPWSVFVFTLVASLFLGLALVVAVFALYTVLDSLGVLSSVNDLYVEVVGGDEGAEPLFTQSRFLGVAAILAAVNVVLLTLLATLASLLYNLCASFTGGIEVTLGERE